MGSKYQTETRVIALAGNPNVGKSTLFNALTGMHQHTGNWPGKTVSHAEGQFETERYDLTLVDLPGTYSLMAHSAEEEVARNFLCFDAPDATVVVCDATCLERNLNLVLQTLEISPRVLVCVNLLDEAERKGIRVDLKALSKRLGVPVIGCVARQKKSLTTLAAALDRLLDDPTPTAKKPSYHPAVERALNEVASVLAEMLPAAAPDPRWLALKLLEGDKALLAEAERRFELSSHTALAKALTRAHRELSEAGITLEALDDLVVGDLMRHAEEICRAALTCPADAGERDRRIDRVLTGKVWGYPLMLLLLALVFWLTISGANYPSALLSQGLFALGERLSALLLTLGTPLWLHDALIHGIWRVLAWVVSVMLPPMAIFFPLFTLLEDVGYLPRIAYNLDRPFQRCRACGKQALTMCMGFGCNAVGVVGCRIIDSPRERLIAMLTNCFVPCNGRFPTLITILSLFFLGTATGLFSSLLSALLLTAVILFGILMTFAVSKLLSATLLRGLPSSFTLELPPYRRPQIGKVIVRSVLDRTLFVLGRAAAVAAPAGLLIWLAANIHIGELSLLSHAAAALDPFAALLGLDGVILIAFLLGFPANEIVIPIMLMAYLSAGTLTDPMSAEAMRALLVANGWTPLTAFNVALFSLMHWPCSTTLLTIKKESGSLKWTALAALIPTLCGLLACALTTAVAGLLG